MVSEELARPYPAKASVTCASSIGETWPLSGSLPPKLVPDQVCQSGDQSLQDGQKAQFPPQERREATMDLAAACYFHAQRYTPSDDGGRRTRTRTLRRKDMLTTPLS